MMILSSSFTSTTEQTKYSSFYISIYIKNTTGPFLRYIFLWEHCEIRYQENSVCMNSKWLKCIWVSQTTWKVVGKGTQTFQNIVGLKRKILEIFAKVAISLVKIRYAHSSDNGGVTIPFINTKLWRMIKILVL